MYLLREWKNSSFFSLDGTSMPRATAQKKRECQKMRGWRIVLLKRSQKNHEEKFEE
jgi:hypothetical protein